ncbi:glycoside hydrolase family 88 protein [Niabella sp. CC-SYL272]|uniref:glycoside hydrolase family 88/105 protein n=1 Tax=Niabella agricola TaxID=2891571 RepID=UPI001F47D78F|nr:glycoside hydrolase family 88 protein [Niabella agricola]MCF3110578.1 glycoside hydrolase family 88 protein [Niabella agricola]
MTTSTFKNLIAFLTLLFFVITNSPASAAGPKPKEVLKIMHRVADWQLENWKTKGFKYPKSDWTNGACYTGLYAAGTLKGGKKYLQTLVTIGNELGWNTGRRRFFADDYCVGQTYAQLSMRYKDKKMTAPFLLLADSILAKPHDEPLNWKNNVHLREWAWCDALFMGPPSLAYLTTATKDSRYLDMAAKLWWKTTDFLYDPSEQLYFRDESYFNKKEKNGKKVFWSRGNGWVLGGLVRMLENMPADYHDRVRFEKLYKEMIQKVVTLQQPDGSWHASLLDPESFPIKEMSGTGFFCYALLWGLNHGLLDKATYWPAAKRAWDVMVSSVHADGMLGYVQRIGAAPDKVNAESTEVYGVGAFLLAGTQLYDYLKK